MNNNTTDKFDALYSAFNKILAGLLALFSVGAGIYKGVNSNSTPEMVGSILGGFIGGLLIVLAFIAIDFGVNIWGKSIDWLSNYVRKHPYARFWIVFPNILFVLYASYLVFKFLNTDLSLRIFISTYLVWLLPAALISLIRDDLGKERTRLSKKVSREIRIQNPQAAIENAFTHLEDHLLKRLSGDSNLYSNKLIRTAYDGEKSRLVYKSDGKDYTEHLYHLMSGAYSIFRNPRHHKIIEDGEQKAAAIISLVELLIEFVDSSDERENKQETQSQESAASLSG
jgi:hypothetical protein